MKSSNSASDFRWRSSADGMRFEFKQRREHDVMDEDWSVSPVTNRLRDKTWSQLGTSGSGNHFRRRDCCAFRCRSIIVPEKSRANGLFT